MRSEWALTQSAVEGGQRRAEHTGGGLHIFFASMGIMQEPQHTAVVQALMRQDGTRWDSLSIALVPCPLGKAVSET